MSTSIIFVDSRVENFASQELPADAVVVFLNAGKDGLKQIAQALAGHTGLDAIHVISHGAAGSLLLGATTLTAANLAAYQEQLQGIGGSLAEGGDLLLYGCNVAQGAAGQAFVDRLALLTGADVAASSDVSGGAGSGGNAVLEFATGHIATTALSLGQIGSLDVISGTSGNDSLVGTDGNDFLDGGAGADTMAGELGDDHYTILDVDDVVVELAGQGTDAVQTTLSGYTLGDHVEDLEYLGAAAFSGNGNALDNVIFGGNAGNTIDGGAGNDVLRGGDGNDSMQGGTGNDTIFRMGVGDDTVDGADGDDTMIVTGERADYSVERLSATLTRMTDADGNIITLHDIEWVQFADGNQLRISEIWDSTPTPYDDSLVGTAGADTLAGGLGDDIYVVNTPADVVVEAADEGYDQVEVKLTTAGTYVMTANVEAATAGEGAVAINITGNALDNLIIGNGAANILIGGAGNDTMVGDRGADQLSGGTGDDLYIVRSSETVVTEQAGQGNDSVQTLLEVYTLSANVENLIYTGEDKFTGTGNALNNHISAGDGGAILDGDAGDDTLVGGAGNDRLLGGAGNDVINGGGDGRDFIDGGAGTDVLQGLGSFASYTVTRPNATDTVLTDAAGRIVTVRNVETFGFADGALTLAQVQLNIPVVIDRNLVGTSDDDTLDGGQGVYTMSGGLGDDTYIITDVKSSVVENDDEGTDLVQVALTASGTYVLAANVENATVTAAASIAVNLTGNALDNELTGNAAANTLTGGAGDDTLDGGAGADKLVGGLGDDRYIVTEAGDSVTELANQGRDSVYTTLSSYTLGANVETLRYIGTGAFTGTGNALDNTITGGDKGNKLDGGAGDDLLRGGDGNDSMQAGTGDDRIDGVGIGKDTVDGGDGSDIMFISGALADYNVERLSATETRLTDADGNSVTFRNVEEIVFDQDSYLLADVWGSKPSAYNDKLVGTSGNDTLDGGLGIDTMAGGDGSDLYVVDNIADVVTELANEGDSDKVEVALKAAGTYAMTANVENATVTAAASVAVNITGNTLDNHIIGNAAANTLTGGAGADTLDGGAGADKLAGGSGDDVYYVDSASDVVTELAGEGNDIVYTTAASYTTAANVEEVWYTGSGAFTGTGNAMSNFIGGSLLGSNKLDGGAGDDTLLGGTANDTLLGGAGNDFLVDSNGGAGTGSGNDSLDGGAGNDILSSRGGRDTIDGGAGNDVLQLGRDLADYTVSRPNATDTVLTDQQGNVYTVRNVETFFFRMNQLTLAQVHENVGSIGDDNLTGTAGDDVLDGGLGVDTLTGGLGDDTYVITSVKSSVVENADEGTDLVQVALKAAGTYVLAANVENATVTAAASVAVNLSGNALDNELIGNAAANTLIGGAGDDLLDGGAGTDKLTGGTGNDSYVVDAAGDVVTELAGEGTDSVMASVATYKLTANVENLSYTGAAAFTGTGNELDNVITGGNGGNKLDGGAGDDKLIGGSGNDSLLGGLGDDSIIGGSGKDTVDGGAGNDTVTLTGNFASYTVTRPNATDMVLTAAGGVAVTLRGVESIVFADGVKTLGEVQGNLVSDFNDYLTGTAGNDTLDGKKGADTLVGGAGDDVYVLDNVGDIVIEQAAQGTDLVQVAAAGVYTLGDNIEHGTVVGTVAASITGNAMDNRLTGNGAANTLTGGAGNDTLDGGAGADKLIGGSGDDVYYVDSASDVVTELANEGMDKVLTTLATYTLAANVEQLQYAGAAAFSGTGNALNNMLLGGTGANTIDGGAGDDTVAGGAGNDSLQGGLGNDLFVGGAVNGIAGVLTGIGTGKDTVDGGLGTDRLVLAKSFASYTVSRPNATDTVLTDAGGNVITVRNVEEFSFDGVSKTLADVHTNIASINNDSLSGTAGDDTLDGAAGIDTLTGGDGNDVYVVDNVKDVVVEVADEGTDLMQVTAAGAYTLAANVENGTVMGTVAAGITGNALDNLLTGNGAANTLAGGIGNDTLDGGAGADKLSGGAGNDTYLVDAAGDVVTELAGEGTDVVKTTLATYKLTANVEDLTYTGVAAFTGTGNELGNKIVGGSGANKLDGGAGNDTLTGGSGNDSLLGGLGDDSFIGGGGKDTIDGGAGSDTLTLTGNFAGYTVSRLNATDMVLTDAGGIAITVRAVESIVFADVVKTLNEMLGNVGSDTNDSLTGTAGNDTLDGKKGADTLAGGAGDDIYVVDNVGDVVVEQAGQGTDLVQVTAAGVYTLGNNVENGTVMGTVVASITGNDLANVLTGNAAVNTLVGGAGNDTLDGGAGADKLSGGLGDDVYIVDVSGDVVTELAGQGVDTVQTVLAAYTLGANVENLYYTGTGAFTGVGNALDNQLAGNMYGSLVGVKLDGGAGNDSIWGGMGNDSLQGGLGDDTIVFSGGLDTVDGGAGEDTIAFFSMLEDYTVRRVNATDVMLTDNYGHAVTVRNIEQFSFFDNGATVNKTLAEVLDKIGGAGNDSVTGTSGNDKLDGGLGIDTLVGGLGNDTYVISDIHSSVVELANEGTDTVLVGLVAPGTYVLPENVEKGWVISTTPIAVNLTGNALANTLTGNAYANILIGGEGKDTLDGGAGRDTLQGGADNDQYIVDDAGDVVVELANEGIDQVLVKLASYTLGAHVEALTFIGTGSFTGTGNELDNSLQGGSDGSKLDGGAGNDTLSGGSGNDSMQGGAGDDLLWYSPGMDTIDGGADNDMLFQLGNFASYQITRPNAGDTVLTDAAGNATTVRNVEVFRFADGDKTLAALQSGIDIDAGAQASSIELATLVGTQANVFVG